MVDGRVAAAETLASPAIEQNVRIAPVVESRQPLNPEAAKAAAKKIDEGLNSGANPKRLMMELLETPSGNGKGNNGEGVSNQQEGSETQNPEDKFKAQLEVHLQKFGLQAQNLESDQRYQQICEQLMADWESQNPEPHKGKQQLTDEERDKWSEWVVNREQFRDTIPPKARESFKQQYEEDFNKYQRYGVYESLDKDPRFKAIYERKIKAIYNKGIVGKEKWSLSSSPEQIAYVHARDEFIQYYPEVAELYAAKDEEVARVLEIEKQQKKAEINSRSNKKDSEPKTNLDDGSKTPEGNQTNPDSNHENTELQALKKQVEALSDEVATLRQQLKDLEAEAGKIVENLLKGNPQITKLLESQRARVTGNEPLESKQSNIRKLLEILLLLLGSGGFIVVSKAKKA